MDKPAPRLDLRQSQSQQLVMNQQMQQAVKLLQLNNVELSEYLEDIVAENPLLEMEDPHDAGSSDNDEGDYDTHEDAREALDDFDAGAAMAGDSAGGRSDFGSSDESDFIANTVSEKRSLRDHLSEQIRTSFDDPRDHMVATLLIDHLDPAGYLRESIEDLSESLSCSKERLEGILPILKHFEPTGIFASSLQECLALQLEEKGKLTPAFTKLLDNLNLLAEHDHKKLAEICGCTIDDIAMMATTIRTLQPKPVSEYDHFVTQAIVPDVLMKKQPREVGGGWRVELNNDTLPRVLVNNEYYTTVLSKSGKEDKSYINAQMNAASWLVKALDQRAQTILKVAAEIVEEQDGFFLYGIEFLRPLTLKQIAEKIEMHESTVSRVTTHKYIGTPRGLFEMKYFFTSSVASASGGDVSSESVKARIKALIDAEDSKKILSDDTLVEMLAAEGIELARRTVAKYRDALNIPSSVQRRRIKKNKAQ
ncbi:MAG: RNA polymerase factor sigma-54 [Pseudobdellovibrionaceae bacterium]